MKKLSRFLAVAAFAVAAAACSMDSMVDKLLGQVAGEANKMCPLRVDEITSLDSVGVATPRILNYYYSITLPADSMDLAVLEEMVVANGSLAAQNPQLEALRKADVTFRYSYYDVNGGNFCTVDITPEMYNAKTE